METREKVKTINSDIDPELIEEIKEISNIGTSFSDWIAFITKVNSSDPIGKEINYL